MIIDMGDEKTYLPTGGFDQYLYQQEGDTLTAPNGVQGKVIIKIDEDRDYHTSLPTYSNSSEVYFKKSDEGNNIIEQARIYKNRKAAHDFDWGHTHQDFKKGVVHVHDWYLTSKGKWVRGASPRYMTEEEIARYGQLFRLACPQIKFRP